MQDCERCDLTASAIVSKAKAEYSEAREPLYEAFKEKIAPVEAAYAAAIAQAKADLNNAASPHREAFYKAERPLKQRYNEQTVPIENALYSDEHNHSIPEWEQKALEAGWTRPSKD